ncbi:hypothetical protein HBB16_18675 [Pseudonocardia sp. MCCB 268]|nr:hypothetical protein [Pseudonocardia cytotoxica]
MRLMVPFLFLSGLSCLFMATAESVGQFTVARIVLASSRGSRLPGPRRWSATTTLMGRAQAFAFLSWAGSPILRRRGHGAGPWTTCSAGPGRPSLPDDRHPRWWAHRGRRDDAELSPRCQQGHLRRRIRRARRSRARELTAAPVAARWHGVDVRGGHVVKPFLLLGTLNAYGQMLVIEALDTSVCSASARS